MYHGDGNHSGGVVQPPLAAVARGKVVEDLNLADLWIVFIMNTDYKHGWATKGRSVVCVKSTALVMTHNRTFLGAGFSFHFHVGY